MDILTITLCAAICGADDWVAVTTFGEAKEPWLRTFLALPHGIPSHDTFGRVFRLLDPADLEAHATVEKGHGQIERRRCRAIGDPAYLASIDPGRAWPSLRSVVRVETPRRVGDDASTEARHYLSSLPADAALLQHAVRAHWGVENRLHWALDVAFREDGSRVRADHASENRAIIRHLALNLLRRRDPARRISLKNSRLKAALDDAYLRSILHGVRT